MKSLRKLTILGGSSPFTVELINCIREGNLENQIGPYHLFLFGRNERNLQLLFEYSRFNLDKIGWKVDFSTNINHALYGSSVVIHQSRYGGLEGRLDDEIFASKMGVPSDETLGPSGLKSALRMASDLKVLARKISSLCPEALIINLTNPLSIAVSILHHEGVSNILGICELPLVTLDKVADILKIPTEQLHWEYSGLNHRGFIHGIKLQGQDVMPLFLDRISISGFDGFHNSLIENLEAIPLKYFHLFYKAHFNQVRANQVKLIGESIIDELILNPIKSPVSLKHRTMDWYRKGIIPVLQSINSSKSAILIINKPTINTLTIESKAYVSNDKITLIKSAKPPAQVRKWLEIFVEHEKATFKAAMDPSPNNISSVLNSDPLVASSNVKAICKSILKTYNRT
ncbi:family 4 glycosyl hydrolase [Daejeonella oryzae]|uniref:family 4 glycosyl hydrolase n=1 Tax=Daejeonella oryzae TaxID=1122943 RepID=UPI00138AE0BB|nr:hypothetical protein [Daejeonella oryzae]